MTRCRAGIVSAALVGWIGAGGCTAHGPWVWADALGTNALAPQPYVVTAGDRLTVHVWSQPTLSGEVLVRTDGFITLPLVGDVAALGQTPAQIASLIATRLDGLVASPHVAVALTATRNPAVAVVGEVRQAGTYELRSGDGVLDAIARAGGLTEYADRAKVFVLRRGEPRRVRFDFDRLSRLLGPGATFVLQDGDVIVVE